MNDGGPAFPGGHGTAAGPTAGMSMRDYFAAVALQGMFACKDYDLSFPQRAAAAYEAADAMLKEREKP